MDPSVLQAMTKELLKRSSKPSFARTKQEVVPFQDLVFIRIQRPALTHSLFSLYSQRLLLQMWQLDVPPGSISSNGSRDSQAYDPQLIESKWAEFWSTGDLFRADPAAPGQAFAS